MTIEDEMLDDGPTLEEAKAHAATIEHEPLPDAADLPTDVRDGDAGDTEVSA